MQPRGKGKEASNLQGEIKIKFTDSAKVLDEDNVQPLINPSQNNNDNKIDIIVTFAMACGETQNFSVPLYSGVFMFKQSIDPKRKVSIAILNLEPSPDEEGNSCGQPGYSRGRYCESLRFQNTILATTIDQV